MAPGERVTRPGGSEPVTALYHHPDARGLAHFIDGPFRMVERPDPPEDEPGFYLWAADARLELRRGGDRAGVHVSATELARRGAGGSALLRACTAGGGPLHVLDAMAGWGVDGLIIASRGHLVTLVERHPAAHALLRDLVRRSGVAGAECRCGDGFNALGEEPPYDVVYLDPMFPAHKSGALPGKRLQWLAELTAPDSRPLTDWIDQAVSQARRRVVLKRRRKDPPVRSPDWRILGTAVRYDVYRGRCT